jgi:hypothetical protein
VLVEHSLPSPEAHKTEAPASRPGRFTDISAHRESQEIDLTDVPFGNAARATATVCSGICGNPFGGIDIHVTPAAARQDNDHTDDHPAPAGPRVRN